MFFVLDTDHMSALEWGSSGVGERLIVRLNALPVGEAATTIITFEEQTRGWLSRNVKDFGLVPGLRVEDWTR